MARNKAPDAIAARRREMVGQLIARRMTRREIVDALAAAGEKNPLTGAPWELATIQRDAAALERQWKTAAARTTAKWKARQLAEIEEVKREAWARGKLDIVLGAIDREVKITGTAAPLEVTGKDGAPLNWPVIVVLPENGRTLPLPQAQLPLHDDGDTDDTAPTQD